MDPDITRICATTSVGLVFYALGYLVARILNHH